jgi:hypothetical protein
LCLRCEKANLACEGYTPYNRFVDEAAKFAKATKKGKTREKQTTNSHSFTLSETLSYSTRPARENQLEDSLSLDESEIYGLGNYSFA